MPDNHSKVRVVLYSRVSDPRGRQEPQNQAIQMRERVSKAAAWVLTHEYQDEFTGGRADRPAFQKMLQDAEAHKFDLVLFWSLDRFSREGVLQTLNHLERLTRAGVAWLSHTEPYLDSMGPFRDAILALLACVAKQERIRIAERIKAGIERRKAAGLKMGGRPKKIDWDYFSRACEIFSTSELMQMFGLSQQWVQKKRLEIMEKKRLTPGPQGE